ncbi:MAG: hypothetical protein AAF685_04165 [Cyanobacteria bacterium P01_C01_bin.89]
MIASSEETQEFLKKIQNDILDSTVALDAILLRSKVLASNLRSKELKLWVKHELNGYPDYTALPDYRIVSSSVLGTLSNGFWQHSNRPLTTYNLPDYMKKGAETIHFSQNIFGLTGMLDSLSSQDQGKDLRVMLPAEWVMMYNTHNADTLSQGRYQLLEAHHSITEALLKQIIGAVRSCLQDLVLELSEWFWDSDGEKISQDEISRIVYINIYGASNSINMGNQGGDTYNVGQAGAVGSNARSDQNTFIQSDNRQSLAKAAEEITQLLTQLEQTNPSATQSEMIAYIEDNTTPSFKRRAGSAIKALGESALDEYVLDNKVLKVIKATVKGWLQPNS